MRFVRKRKRITYRIVYEKYINERVSYDMIYSYEGFTYRLKFVSDGYQAPKIIRGFVETIRVF